MRFFAGLSPVQVFVLPNTNTTTSTHHARIVQWDAADTDNAYAAPANNNNKRQGVFFLERHPCWFRVVCKFASAPVASLAVQRSGEILYLSGDSTTSSDGVQRGACVAVTPMPKSTAVYLHKNLVSHYKILDVQCQAHLANVMRF